MLENATTNQYVVAASEKPHFLLILTTCVLLMVRKAGKHALAKFQQTKGTAKDAGQSNHA